MTNPLSWTTNDRLDPRSVPGRFAGEIQTTPVQSSLRENIVLEIQRSANASGVKLLRLAMDVDTMLLSFDITIDGQPYTYQDTYQGDLDGPAFIDVVRRKIQAFQKHHAQLDARRQDLEYFKQDLYPTGGNIFNGSV